MPCNRKRVYSGKILHSESNMQISLQQRQIDCFKLKNYPATAGKSVKILPLHKHPHSLSHQITLFNTRVLCKNSVAFFFSFRSYKTKLPYLNIRWQHVVTSVWLGSTWKWTKQKKKEKKNRTECWWAVHWVHSNGNGWPWRLNGEKKERHRNI